MINIHIMEIVYVLLTFFVCTTGILALLLYRKSTENVELMEAYKILSKALPLSTEEKKELKQYTSLMEKDETFLYGTYEEIDIDLVKNTGDNHFSDNESS